MSTVLQIKLILQSCSKEPEFTLYSCYKMVALISHWTVRWLLAFLSPSLAVYSESKRTTRDVCIRNTFNCFSTKTQEETRGEKKVTAVNHLSALVRINKHLWMPTPPTMQPPKKKKKKINRVMTFSCTRNKQKGTLFHHNLSQFRLTFYHNLHITI